MRGLSEKFMDDLLRGKLYPILERVQNDHTLMLAIRDDYINIYYRGGNILRVTEDKGFYQTFFNVKYGLGQSITNSEDDIKNQADAKQLVAYLPDRKVIMDKYFVDNGKAEREFQQLVARENNFSSISNETEYFITDIEFTAPYGRFDMLAVLWPANQRKNGDNCKATLIEVKYGDGALAGRAGLLEHLKDMDKFISDKTQQYANLLQTMESQFNQLDELGLLKYNKGTSNAQVKLNVKKTPEVLFIIANHNPRSSKLKTILSNPEIDEYEHSKLFELRFYVAAFAGYGLHANCMRTLAQFRDLL